jgi:hypothetical protein
LERLAGFLNRVENEIVTVVVIGPKVTHSSLEEQIENICLGVGSVTLLVRRCYSPDIAEVTLVSVIGPDMWNTGMLVQILESFRD